NCRRQRYLKQVPDQDERAVMKMILAWRSQQPPWSWHQIYEKLNYDLKLRTADGREWDESRIRRACRAEAILQSTEARAGQDQFQVPERLAGSTMATEEVVGRGVIGVGDQANPVQGEQDRGHRRFSWRVGSQLSVIAAPFVLN